MSDLVRITCAVTEDGRLIFHFNIRASRPSVHGLGTPGTGVIVVGCKSPVRVWEPLVRGQYTK